jgi:hypothetical protein
MGKEMSVDEEIMEMKDEFEISEKIKVVQYPCKVFQLKEGERVYLEVNGSVARIEVTKLNKNSNKARVKIEALPEVRLALPKLFNRVNELKKTIEEREELISRLQLDVSILENETE